MSKLTYTVEYDPKREWYVVLENGKPLHHWPTAEIAERRRASCQRHADANPSAKPLASA